MVLAMTIFEELGFKDTIIEPHVWDECKEQLVRNQDTWGMIELGYRSPDDFDIEFEYEKNLQKQKVQKREK